jgi:NAD(P)-dependent dehydrogenase (short-subunit alcohol dehydrogenase family)
LPFCEVASGGVLLTETVVQIAGENYFRERAPWRIGIVKLDCGPQAVANLHSAVRCGERVNTALVLDRSGAPTLLALPAEGSVDMQADRQLREFICDPKGRRVLVTDGRSAIGRAMLHALREAQADLVFVGLADPWKPFVGEGALQGCAVVALDVTDTASVMECAGQMGARVDIVINTAEHVRPGGIMHELGVNTAKAALDTSCLGLMRLAQAFGPILAMRGAETGRSACAFVNMLAAHALMNWPEYAAVSAAEAAKLSVSQAMRAELRPGGIRVINVFTGPVETEWYQTVPPPKVTPATLARAAVAALRGGVEDVYVGDVAEDYRARLVANPKALERELGA